jgi:hypothetical protein
MSRTMDADRQAEAAADRLRRITAALTILRRIDTADPARTAVRIGDAILVLESGRDTPHADRDPRVDAALAAIGPVNVGLLPGQAGDILRQVHTALTRDGAAMQA